MVWEFSKHFYTTNSPKWGTSMNIIEHEELHYLHRTDNMHAWRECGQLFSAKLMEGMRAAILCHAVIVVERVTLIWDVCNSQTK